MKSLIGQKYISSDNSYHLWLSRDTYNQDKGLPELAGTLFKNPVETIIVSEPYEQEVLNVVEERVTKQFINVRYQRDICRVLFYVDNVGADINKRIAENNERKMFYQPLPFY